MEAGAALRPVIIPVYSDQIRSTVFIHSTHNIIQIIN